MNQQIQFTLNGKSVSPAVPNHRLLLDLLRDEIGMTGTKEGCGTGDCGACSVTVNGRLVCSCLVLGAEVQGAKVGTIEGMAKGDQLHPLQTKFVELAALQCGICTPGFLIAAKDLLAKNPDPNEEEIRFGLAGNLCRCTGYQPIVQAVQRAAAEMRATDGVSAAGGVSATGSSGA